MWNRYLLHVWFIVIAVRFDMGTMNYNWKRGCDMMDFSNKFSIFGHDVFQRACRAIGEALDEAKVIDVGGGIGVLWENKMMGGKVSTSF